MQKMSTKANRPQWFILLISLFSLAVGIWTRRAFNTVGLNTATQEQVAGIIFVVLLLGVAAMVLLLLKKYAGVRFSHEWRIPVIVSALAAWYTAPFAHWWWVPFYDDMLWAFLLYSAGLLVLFSSLKTARLAWKSRHWGRLLLMALLAVFSAIISFIIIWAVFFFE